MNGQSLFRDLTIFMGLVSLDVMSMHTFRARISRPPHQDSNAEGLKTCLNTLHLGVDQHCKQGSKMNIMIKQKRVLNNIMWFSSCTDNAENVCMKFLDDWNPQVDPSQPAGGKSTSRICMKILSKLGDMQVLR